MCYGRHSWAGCLCTLFLLLQRLPWFLLQSQPTQNSLNILYIFKTILLWLFCSSSFLFLFVIYYILPIQTSSDIPSLKHSLKIKLVFLLCINLWELFTWLFPTALAVLYLYFCPFCRKET
jgi:hypothetical protein